MQHHAQLNKSYVGIDNMVKWIVAYTLVMTELDMMKLKTCYGFSFF